jgi:predicted DCC family thiol-disulfide oxidoreductase YuxK
MADQPLLIFDGNCGFCRKWVDYGRQITGDRVRYAPSNEVASEFPQIPPDAFARAVQVVLPDGEVLEGARAVFETLRYAPGLSWPAWMYQHVPGFAPTTEAAYRIIASHRPFFDRLTVILFGSKLIAPTYQRVEWLFLRLLAAVYLTAFLSFGVQAAGLIGSHGILPMGRYLDAVRANLGTSGYWSVPTLFWLAHSDPVLIAVCIAGAVIAVVLMLGFLQRTGLVALFVLYLSVVAVGQDFLGFQWDYLLLEMGFLAIFLGQSKVTVWLFRWLLFRLVFLSGYVKLASHDPSWRGLSALSFHYQTQPLPMPLAWYAQQLPAWFQQSSTGMVFFIELAIPFLAFAPRRVRLWGAGWMLALQVLILLTGNYAFFNLLAISLCLFLLDDEALGWVRAWRPMKRIHWGPVAAAAVVVVSLSVLELSGMFFELPAPAVVRVAAPFGIVNTYGLFAVMTTTRPEIIVQGSNDGDTWLDYEFPYKPGDLKRAPRWVAPHQPRLDWQMWFAALSNWRASPWIVNFMVRLLEGSPDVLKLLERNPFPGAPPKFVRAVVYDYSFTTFAERRETEQWWKREWKGVYLRAISLADVTGR